MYRFFLQVMHENAKREEEFTDRVPGIMIRIFQDG